MDLDSALRREIYAQTLTRGVPPRLADLARALDVEPSVAQAGVSRLAAGRIVVLQPGSRELLMVPPFSAVPTPFLIQTSRYNCYANCAWDALGVPLMLREPARVVAACGCCGEAMTIDVTLDHAPSTTDVIHFAVPAARWWRDVVFT
jgi:Alkylmercury lyase